MLTGIRDAMSYYVGKPAVVADFQIQYPNRDYDNAVDSALIALRTGSVFLAILALSRSIHHHLNCRTLIARTMYLEQMVGLKKFPIVSIAVTFACAFPIISTLGSALLTSYLVYRKEKQRALSTVYKFVSEEFKAPVHHKTMAYLAHTPSAVKALLDIDSKAVRSQTDQGQNQTLLRYVVQQSAKSNLADRFKVFQLIIDSFAQAEEKISPKDVLALLGSGNPMFIHYATSKEVIPNLSKNDIFSCWKQVQSLRELDHRPSISADALADWLIQNNFSINSVNENDTSLLLEETIGLFPPIANKDSSNFDRTRSNSNFYWLLKHGAFLEDLNVPITINNGIQPIKKTVRDWLGDKPEYLQALEQAQQASQALPPPSYKTSLGAFWKPAVIATRDQFRVKDEDIFVRTLVVSVIGTAVIMGAVVALANRKSQAFLGAVLPYLFTGAYCVWEKIRATRKLDSIALELFTNSRFPETLVTRHIGRNPSLTQALIKQSAPEVLNKRNTAGMTLLEETRSFSTDSDSLSFTLLAEHFKPSLTGPEKAEHLLRALSHCSFQSAQILIEKDIVLSIDLTHDQIIECFALCPTPSFLQLLKDKGFNVNTKDGNGWTPLLKVASRGTGSQLKYDLINKLLELGANPEARVNVIDVEHKGVSKTVVDFLTGLGQENIRKLVQDKINA